MFNSTIKVLCICFAIAIAISTIVFAKESSGNSNTVTHGSMRSVLGQMLNVPDPDMTMISIVERIANSTTLSITLFDSEGNSITTGGDLVELMIIPESFTGMVSEALDNQDGSYTVVITTPGTKGDADLEVIPVINGAISKFFEGVTVLGSRHFELTNASNQTKGSTFDTFLLLILVLLLTRRKQLRNRKKC